jgi:hypothetical protein
LLDAVAEVDFVGAVGVGPFDGWLGSWCECRGSCGGDEWDGDEDGENDVSCFGVHGLCFPRFDINVIYIKYFQEEWQSGGTSLACCWGVVVLWFYVFFGWCLAMFIYSCGLCYLGTRSQWILYGL